MFQCAKVIEVTQIKTKPKEYLNFFLPLLGAFWPKHVQVAKTLENEYFKQHRVFLQEHFFFRELLQVLDKYVDKSYLPN